MSDNRLPTEVELVYEVMPCNAMRTVQEPVAQPHPCSYFRKWGTYHSYDYSEDGPPPQPGVVQDSVYVGRAALVPEMLSGCRKAPIMSVGINPNLPGWWQSRHGSLNPLLDDYKQFAHYFRYRAVSKLELPEDDYQQFGGGSHDRPLLRVGNQVVASKFELNVARDAEGRRPIPVQLAPQSMYEAYQSLLDSLAEEMGWNSHELIVGEDLSYGNMVACPSARWTTRPTPDPLLPIMTNDERSGIVNECFHDRKYFLRQLFQSLPPVLLIFSQSTANAFIGEMQDRFIEGDPAVGDSLDDLMQRTVRLHYGDLSDGTSLTARIIFAPHITGNPQDFIPARRRVVAQMVEEAEAGNLQFNAATKHLRRPRGSCVFCPMLQIGDCDYIDELTPLSDAPVLTADSSADMLLVEKKTQLALLAAVPALANAAAGWDASNDQPDKTDEPEATAVAPSAVLFADEIGEDDGPTYLLRGRIVTMNKDGDIIPNGLLAISRGVIRSVLNEGDPLPQAFSGVPIVDTEGTIYPGLIDLHNHFVYNVLPLWVVPRKYLNRSQWPRHPEYKSGVSMPIRDALARYSVTAEAIVRYVEARALLGGTTTGQGMRTKVKGGARLFRGAMRNVEETADSRLPEARTRVPDLSVTGASGEENIRSFHDALAQTTDAGAAYFYHLSEGTDDVARRHFINLQNNDLIAPSLVGVHSLGLAREDFDALAENGAKVVWSPFSNLLLYGQTLDLQAVKDSGVKLSLGCDWTPSGSKNLFQELKVASFVNKQQGSPFTVEQLVRFVTSEAAEVTGWHEHLGQLQAGMLADVLVLSGTDGDPYEDLIDALESEVRLVGVQGIARVGDPDLMRALHVGTSNDLETFDVNGTEKLLYLNSPTSPINQLTLGNAIAVLRDAMADLPGFIEQQKAAEGQLLAMGIEEPQRFTIEMDNEFNLFDDPLLEIDEFGVEAELLADVQMVESLPLEDIVVNREEADYWQRVMDEPNLPDALKSYFQQAYELP
jgi:cytosine/adenosine deaminase-related metal-dependent hydrolase